MVTIKSLCCQKFFTTCPSVFRSCRGRFQKNLENYIRIFNQIKTAYRNLNVSVNAPICQNHLLKPGQVDAMITFCRDSGIKTFLDLYINGQFASYKQFRTKFNSGQLVSNDLNSEITEFWEEAMSRIYCSSINSR